MMTFLIRSLTLPEFALRAVSRAVKGDWLALVVPERTSETAAARLLSELRSLGKIHVASEVLSHPANARDLQERLAHERKHVAVVIASVQFSSEEWAHLDLLRSRLGRSGPTILILSRDSVEVMAESAPNILSWIGGSIWEADLDSDELSEAKRQGRLSDLRAWSRITDQELIRRAESGELGREPEFVEWLALLGRSDLVDKHKPA
jgi:hypothetical protein